MQERLHKYIARCGIASRRKSEDLIIKGLVMVNGVRVTQLGTTIHPLQDKIVVQQKLIHPPKENIYFILNKPVGYITTTDDPEKRATIMDLLKGIHIRLFPVGRLDADSEGLLLLTNDGTIANRLAHPRYQIKKLYKIILKEKINDNAIKILEKGIRLDDGITAPAKIKIQFSHPKQSQLTIEMAEGKKRQIRRMFDFIGFKVIRLVRIKFGPLHLGKLRPGEYRNLTDHEIELLKKLLL